MPRARPPSPGHPDDRPSSRGLVHDAVGPNHLRPVGTATSALVLHGTATDDAHYYFESLKLSFSPNSPNEGWVTIRAPVGAAEPELLAALRRGDFYATHGARLDEVSWARGCLRVRASDPEARIDGIAVTPAG